jgi:hypothetical protein
MSSIEAALAAIELLKPGEKLVYAQIVREYTVEPTMLAQIHQGALISRNTQAQNQQGLHPQQDEKLLHIHQTTHQTKLVTYSSYDTKFALKIVQKSLEYIGLIALYSNTLSSSSQNTVLGQKL